MIRANTLWSVTALWLLASCGDRTIQTSSGDANKVAANEDPTPDAMDEGVHGDPWNCGEKGYKCLGPMGIGECIDDECTGRLHGCFVGGTTCADLCADEGVVCREAACDGATAFGWGVSSPEASIELCTYAEKEWATPLTIGCDEAIPFDAYPGVRCCCRFEG